MNKLRYDILDDFEMDDSQTSVADIIDDKEEEKPLFTEASSWDVLFSMDPLLVFESEEHSLRICEQLEYLLSVNRFITGYSDVFYIKENGGAISTSSRQLSEKVISHFSGKYIFAFNHSFSSLKSVFSFILAADEIVPDISVNFYFRDGQLEDWIYIPKHTLNPDAIKMFIKCADDPNSFDNTDDSGFSFYTRSFYEIYTIAGQLIQKNKTFNQFLDVYTKSFKHIGFKYLIYQIDITSNLKSREILTFENFINNHGKDIKPSIETLIKMNRIANKFNITTELTCVKYPFKFLPLNEDFAGTEISPEQMNASYELFDSWSDVRYAFFKNIKSKEYKSTMRFVSWIGVNRKDCSLIILSIHSNYDYRQFIEVIDMLLESQIPREEKHILE